MQKRSQKLERRLILKSPMPIANIQIDVPQRIPRPTGDQNAALLDGPRWRGEEK